MKLIIIAFVLSLCAQLGMHQPLWLKPATILLITEATFWAQPSPVASIPTRPAHGANQIKYKESTFGFQ